ncbi:MAG TPA: sodium:solute symporter family protein [Thermoanaerobaculia bacterium]|nr:sodium:solute symporter family protein [Thermoanaerobaculia bacterium]
MTLAVVLSYLALVLVIGVLSHRLAVGTGEDYFVAGRTIGPFVLLMTLFGTHMTSFALLGASAESYRVGIGVFALMASSSALMVPLVFFFVGTRVWAVGKRLGLMTQVQFVRERWGSDLLGIALFVVLVLLLVPYLLIGVIGGGITLAEVTDGRVPTWLGGLLVSVVVVAYVCYGGLRGTSWVNTFQTTLFMVLGGITVAVIVSRLGGLETALARLREVEPAMLVRGERIAPIQLLSYTLIPLSVGMFPHIFVHWLSARSAAAFRAPVALYPLCIVVVWVPSVLLGVLGHLDFPGLEGAQANSVLVRMIALHAPGILGGLLGAGVFAAIMSSLDSQSLSIGTMFTHDVVRHHRRRTGRSDLSERQQVWVGRMFVVAVVAVTFGLSLVVNRRIFGLAVWSFTGFAALLPILLAGLFWRRSTAAGALASLATVVASWTWFFVNAWGRPDYSVGGTGLDPVVVIFAGSVLAMVVGSLASRPPDPEQVARFFPTAARR